MTITIVVPPFLEVVVGGIITVFSWLFGTVVFRYMILPSVGHYLASKLGSELRPSEREEIIARHYRSRRRGNIHQPRWPWLCEDGKCPLL
jgi:hypothetical protein